MAAVATMGACTQKEKSEVTDQNQAARSAKEGAKAAGREFEAIELDRFIEREIADVGEFKGRKLVKMAVPVSFAARMKRRPEEKQMTYIYTALEVADIRPLPEVGHRMFVESKEGRIVPVYVEKQAAARLVEELAEGAEARFSGYHVYSYSKGPALLVVDFVPAGREEGVR
ncbi:hypothetical protein AW736_07150 [Termitidicoccus mucosus]|uniref:Uncharacterized protein n=2 Tax=Termitidicoccus mucosus TaxID=1184151 RepID=A0A178ILM5_9BACT|nr:hypothetical protein AW736_07150 [Opitutaceae bacterium TSB47]